MFCKLKLRPRFAIKSKMELQQIDILTLKNKELTSQNEDLNKRIDRIEKALLPTHDPIDIETNLMKENKFRQIKNALKEFIENSTIHGLPNIVRSDSKLIKITYAIAFVVYLGLCIWYSNDKKITI